ncbi:MAG: hypothetical protein ACJAW4_001688 [Paracoccaceae bacterium]|jgi:hypothetical protein
MRDRICNPHGPGRIHRIQETPRQIIGDEKAAIKIRTLPFHGRLWGRNIWGVMRPSASRLG